MTAMTSADGTILVTGAAGFIGSAWRRAWPPWGTRGRLRQFQRLLRPGAQAATACEALLAAPGVACQTVELADARSRSRRCSTASSRALVVHLAAQAGVRYSLKNPAAYVQSNLVGFGHMLEACRQHQVQHLLYASSSSVYGANAKMPFSEDDRTDAAGVAVRRDQEGQRADGAYRTATCTACRPPACASSRCTARGAGRTWPISASRSKMLAGEPIPVFAEGKLYRDFTYIDDIVEGVVRLLFKPTHGRRASRRMRSSTSATASRCRCWTSSGRWKTHSTSRRQLDFQPMQPGDVPATHADTSRLQDWVGYKPTTSLEAGLREFAQWYNRADT